MIAALLGVCELVVGAVLPFVTDSVQILLAGWLAGWLVIFTAGIAGAFFWILWKKPYVFYPPTEFGPRTNVSEYVGAFGGNITGDYRGSQNVLLQGPWPPSDATEDGDAQRSEVHESDLDLEETLRRYYGFKRMRVSDTSAADAASL